MPTYGFRRLRFALWKAGRGCVGRSYRNANQAITLAGTPIKLLIPGFLDQWLAEVAKARVRPWTYHDYEVQIRRHIKPLLGRIALDRLTPQQVQFLLNEKLREGLKPKTVRYLRRTLRTALNEAMRWGLVSRNAAALVEGPRVERYAIHPFTPDKARKFPVLSTRWRRTASSSATPIRQTGGQRS